MLDSFGGWERGKETATFIGAGYCIVSRGEWPKGKRVVKCSVTRFGGMD